ncbi:MAG: hypothetical protein ACU4EQ_12070 [Candidatus Nitrosoglobus sp.]
MQQQHTRRKHCRRKFNALHPPHEWRGGGNSGNRPKITHTASVRDEAMGQQTQRHPMRFEFWYRRLFHPQRPHCQNR